MSRVVTEIVILTFKPDINTDELLARAIEVISRQPGLRRVKWGRWEEDANKVQMMINWDDISSHHKFAQSTDYPDLLALLDTTLAAPVAIIHVHFDEDAINKVLDDPVVELATLYGVTDGFEEAISRTLAVGSESDGFLRCARGHVVEEIAVSEEAAKGKGHFTAVSWTSLQARWDATKRKEVQESGLLVVEKIAGYEVHHVKFR
ncbi:hypothetical protein BJX76DRAFT_315824 [Aspergillus varians]